MMNNFYTYFDMNYFCRGLALYYSMRQWMREFTLFVLCLDEATYRFLQGLRLDYIIPIQISDLENYDNELLSKKNERSNIEYYFSCTASFGCYIFEYYNNFEILTYLDGDTYFFEDPAPVLHEVQEYSVAITPHRFSDSQRELEKYGIYNVGWVSFKRDKEGLACLAQWRKDCLNWCGANLEGGQYGDQKYLDSWPLKYRNVRVIDHFGVNAGPWNLGSVKLRLKNERLYVNNDPLVLYHFHHLLRLTNYFYLIGSAKYSLNECRIIRNKIYLPYVIKLRNLYLSLNEELKEALPKYGILEKEFSYRNFLPFRNLLLVI